MQNRFVLVGLVIIAVLAGVELLEIRQEHGGSLTLNRTYAREASASTDARERIGSGDLSFENAFELTATAISPSVVSITSTHIVQAPQTPESEFPQSPFGNFFGNGQNNNNNPFRFFFPQMPRSYHEEALGSGVIISKDGYILTNNHVVAGGTNLQVQLSDNQTFKAKVIGADPKSDVAVIKINAHNLVAAKLGNSDDLRVGEWVMAAGAPFGLRQTVSAGIISATGRSNVGIADYEDFLQTDAAINPGNSGGPLVDLHGQVIGINTAIATRDGGFQGIGFAIPINMADHIMEELIKTGHVTRAWLGVVIQQLTPQLAESFGYSKNQGVLISQVTPDSPASKADLQSGDIIMTLDGRPASDIESLRNEISQGAVGSTVNLGIWRNKKTMDVKVKLEQLPNSISPTGEAQSQGIADLGLRLVDPTPDNLQHFGLGEHVTGAVVAAVEPGSPAADAGIRPGDVLQQVQDKTIQNADQATDALSHVDLKKGLRLRVLSHGMVHYVFISTGG